jgi:hypothetical protein
MIALALSHKPHPPMQHQPDVLLLHPAGTKGFSTVSYTEKIDVLYSILKVLRNLMGSHITELLLLISIIIIGKGCGLVITIVYDILL